MKLLQSCITTTWYVFISSIRNPETIFFGFAFPLIFTAVFSVVGGGPSNFDVGVLSTSNQESIVFEALKELDTINLITTSSDEEILNDLERGHISAVIEIVTGSNKSSQENMIEDVYITTSSANPQNGEFVKQIVDRVIITINQTAFTQPIELARLNIEEIEGREYTQVDFILPGQLSFALLSSAVFGTGFAIITLRQTLVLKRMIATSSPRWIIIGSKVMSNMVIAILQAVVVIGVGKFFFDFTLVNGWQTFFEMITISVFGLLVFMSFGVVVGSIARTGEAASPLANVITLPQFILSGAFFPLEAFPEWLQTFASFLPMTYLNDALRTISFEGGSFIAVLPQLSALLVWAVVVYIPAIRLFRWE